jgi:hypothetical protein
MSKKALGKYLKELRKEELEEQILELYERLKEVKQYYDFIFNPKEDKMLDEAKFKIYREYFPQKGRKPKKRRSVAQRHIKNFLKLGVDPKRSADLMLYNIEVASLSNEEKRSRQITFYTSMFKSFKEAAFHIDRFKLGSEFDPRLEELMDQIYRQNWPNLDEFEKLMNVRYSR